MPIDKYDFVYDPEEPGDVAPDRLISVFDNLDEDVDRYIESHPSFNYDAYLRKIDSLKQSLKSASKRKKKQLREDIEKKIKDLEWMMVNYRVEAQKNLLLWEYPRSVHSLKVKVVRGREEWIGLVWYSKNQRQTVELTDEYVRYLLTAEAYKKQCFRSGEFVALRKYDRQSTVDETHFRGVRKISSHQFQVVDCQGQKVNVSIRWACKNLPKESIQDAVKHSTQEGFRLIPLGCPRVKESGVVECISEGQAEQLPFTMYQNIGRQHKCMPKCFASALHFLGYKKEAARIGKSNDASACQFEGFKNLVLETMKSNGWIVRYRKSNYNPYDACKRRDNPVIVSLKAATMDDGKTVTVSINHSVCFVGDYVFDANRERALLISRESLDTICDDIVPGSFYNGIYWDRELVVKPKL